MISAAVVLDRPLLAKVLGMLGSPNDGEVLAAARQAERMLRQAGADWPGVIGSDQHSCGRVASQAIIDGDGRTILPPYGSTWRDTVWHLSDLSAARHVGETMLLDRLAVVMRRAPLHRPPPIGHRVARKLCEMYAARAGDVA